LQAKEDAVKFYNAKVDELGANLKDLESIVQGKSNNLRIVEDGKWTLNLLMIEANDLSLSIATEGT